MAKISEGVSFSSVINTNYWDILFHVNSYIGIFRCKKGNNKKRRPSGKKNSPQNIRTCCKKYQHYYKNSLFAIQEASSGTYISKLPRMNFISWWRIFIWIILPCEKQIQLCSSMVILICSRRRWHKRWAHTEEELMSETESPLQKSFEILVGSITVWLSFFSKHCMHFLLVMG